MPDETISRGDAVALLRALVQIDSRNPSLVTGGPGEGAVSRFLAAVLDSWGFRVELQDAAPGRPNVIAHIGPPGGRRLMFNGHLDVVDVGGMVHAPFAAETREGRLYGRGSSDMKGGVAAMCAAAARAAPRLRGEVVIAAVVDEEFASVGTRALVDAGHRAEAAIVTEPTRLAIGPAHRGFTWIELEFRGRAAHGSRYDLGADAIAHAGALLHELECVQRDVLMMHTHPLLGHASVHASTIAGGVGWSTYPDRCVLQIERRTLPGESPALVLAEFSAACERARAMHPALDVRTTHVLTRSPSDVKTDAPIVRALSRALRAERETEHIVGVSAWTDAAILNEAGIPAICFGPGDMSLAHADEEFITLDEVERATRVLSRLAIDWFGEDR